MNQREAVVEAMRANGGFATVGHLCKEALKIPRREVEDWLKKNHPELVG